MLNTDMELAYDIDVNNSGEGTTCIINENVGGGRGQRPPRGGGGGPRARGRGLLATREGEEICADAATKTLVQQYANVSSRLSYN